MSIKILIIKMSSMGDVIHTLPALTDAMHAIPNIEIDWAIEPAFADIAAWHPAVKKIIPVALRQWRKRFSFSEIKQVYSQLREKKYDAIIDAQGLLKSVMVMKCTRGETHGFDKSSVREKMASFFYQNKHEVNGQQHAVLRTRLLFSKALHYPLPTTEPDYCIDEKKLPLLNFVMAKKYFVFLHGTTWPSKHYPEIYWETLLAKTNAEKIPVYLPWGNTTEKNRAEKWVAQFDCVSALPKLSIAQMAAVLNNASAVVGGDTGFTHLCAALSTPTISLYGPTDPIRIGALGKNQIHLAAKFPCAPCYSKTCWYAKKHHADITPTCFTSIGPDLVWEYLREV